MTISQTISAVDPGSTASSLVAGIKSMDPTSWRRLATDYGPLVYKWARWAGLCSEDSADLTQEVFRVVITAIDRFQHGRVGDTFRGWLWAVTRNKIHDFRRRRVRDPLAAGGSDANQQLLLISENDSEGTPTGPNPVNERLRQIVGVVRCEFEEQSWQAFWRVTVDGRQAGDVALELGISPNAVYVARSRILKRMRELLSEAEGLTGD